MSAGRSTRETDQRANPSTRAPAAPRKRLVYVIPQLGPGTVEHFAHIPSLLTSLSEHVDVAVVVERGGFPDSDRVTRIMEINGTNPFSRLRRSLQAVARCAAAGHDTYFLRYSRLFVLVLLVTYPLYRHRILLWMSGTADLPQPHRRRKSVRGRFEDAITWLVLRGVDRLVTGPETMVDVMSRRWNLPRRRISLLYNDIDPEWFVQPSAGERHRFRDARGWAPDDFVMLFVHRLSFRRGTRLLAPLLNAVRAALDRPVRLVVVGDGPDRATLEGAAAVTPGLEIVGALPNDRVSEWYGAADCFVMPSYEEGFPRVLLEAMVARLPIVTTRAGGSADVVGPDYPYLAPTGDLDTLTRHLVAIANLPSDQRAAVGVALHQRAADRFSTPLVARLLADLL
jgi:glycosyltransferase involved in cell wall biosynthesis